MLFSLGASTPNENSQSDPVKESPIKYVSVLIAVFAIPQAFAQPMTMATRQVPTPDWAVWRAFHDSLAFYRERSPTRVQEVLTSEAGLTDSEADIVYVAGQQYLGQLTKIDDAERAEIAAQFKPKDLPGANLAFTPSPGAQQGFTVGQMANGRSNYDAMVADGLLTRVDQQRNAALREHLSQLAKLLSSTKLAALQTWVKAKIGPTVKTYTMVPSPSAMVPLPPPGASPVGGN